ncbi:MAG: peptidoglycan-binding protein, partial [Tangfeifania sp.]
MHHILIPILSLAFFLNLENPGQDVSSEKEEKETVANKPVLPAHRMENLRVNHYFNLNEFSHWHDEVRKFYSARNYKLAWFENGRLNNMANDFINELKNSSQEGFPDTYYELLPVNKAFTEMKNNPGFIKFFPHKIVELDILLTQTYLKFASDLSSGLVKPGKLEVDCEVPPSEQNLTDALNEAMESRSIAESLQKLKPENPQYRSLIEARRELKEQKLNGGWPLPGQVSKLKENDSSENVIRIKKYLMATGDLASGDSVYLNSPVFDSRLIEAVKIFQARHGLKQDGIVGKNTIREMNQPIDYRLDQIKVNLDRLRWENQRSHQKYIAIN